MEMQTKKTMIRETTEKTLIRETAERTVGWRIAAAMKCAGHLILGSRRGRPQPTLLPEAPAFVSYG